MLNKISQSSIIAKDSSDCQCIFDGQASLALELVFEQGTKLQLTGYF